MTQFRKTVLTISKNFPPEDKPVCQLLRNTSSCKSFFSRDPISVVSPVDVVNVNV